QTDDPDDARKQVAELAAQQVDCIKIWMDDLHGRQPKIKMAAVDAILEEARKYNIPVTAHIFSLADTEHLVNSGASGSLHIIRNTRRMAVAGVPIGVGSDGGSSIDFPGSMTHRELELLVEAGLSPVEVITAATRNGALALRKLDELATIEAGKRADLLLLKANPLEDVRNFRKIDQLMLDGEWVDRAGLKTK